MKKVVTTILTLMLLTSLIYGQNQGFSVPKLENKERHIKEHDRFLLQNHNKLKSNTDKGILYKPLVISTDNNTTRHTYLYDSYGRVTTELWENLNNGVWMNSARATMNYDLIGNILVRLTETWNIGSSTWVNSDRYSYTYSSNAMTYSIELFSSGVWMNYLQLTYTYDVNGIIQKLLVQNWNNGWENTNLQSYFYDLNGNIVSFLDQSWDISNNTWGNHYKHTYTYDTHNNRLTFLFEEWLNGVYVNNGRESYTYDSSDNRLTWLWEEWENGEWANQRRSATTYDSHNNMTAVLHESWENGAWTNFSRLTYAYDISDNMLTELEENWGTQGWVNYTLLTYTYDITRNAITGKAEKWENNTWVNNIYGYLTLTSNYKNDYLYVSGYNCTVQYTQFSDVDGELNNSLVFSLNQNYPNPFNPSTSISFSLPNDGFVTLKVYDVLGKEVTTLINEDMNAGKHTKMLDASNLCSGVYFYKLQAGKYNKTKKMILIR